MYCSLIKLSRNIYFIRVYFQSFHFYFYSTGSCPAGVRPPVFHTLPPGAPPPPPPPSHESALAQLMQCEQRILHRPGMPHFREAAPPGPWVGHRHGPPPPQPFIPVSHHHEDLWHAGQYSCCFCFYSAV